MGTRLASTCTSALAVVALSACATGGSGSGTRDVYDTRDLVVEAQVPETGFWYVAEATTADAVDDVELDFGPLSEGAAPRDSASGLAPMLVSGDVPEDLRITVDFRVTSFDTADNAEVRCSVYFEGNLVVEDVVDGASSVAACRGDFDLADFR